MKNKFLAAALVTATMAIGASLLVGAHVLPLPALIPELLRWLAILLIAAYATSRRSLTTWILVGLLAGAEFGHDWPAVAVNLQLLGTIFLRLIKVIIAPLLFGVLVVGIAESLSETMFKFTNLVMYAAPLGVFGAVAYTVGHLGLGVLLPLLKLLATMYVALAFFILCVLLPIALWARIPIKRFINAIAGPVTLGFATASSEATLPSAMEQLEFFGVPRQIVAFVLPTGYSFNMDGASLYQSLALFFVVQAAGLHLSIGQQALMILTLIISSKGTAGVARGSLLIVFGAATSFHLPMEPLFLLFAIDQLMDMGRTAVTVLGNCVACVVIARWEGEFPAKAAASS